MRSTWLFQLQEFQRLSQREGLPVQGERGDLKSAYRFSELLTLTSNVTSVERLIKDDREGALSFMEVAANMNEVVADAVEEPSTSELGGPFHELADLMVEFLSELRRLDPKKFE